MGNTKAKLMGTDYKAENAQHLFKFLAEELNGLVPSTIVELGARDCRETIMFNKEYPQARIYTFECNPDKLPECRERVKGISNITLIEKAVTDKEGKITFHQIDTEKTETVWADGNPGASSLYKATGKYTLENYVQKEVEVTATTLKNELPARGVKNIDLLWMDIQGAELAALKGLGNMLQQVSVIHSEVEFFEMYEGQALFWDVKSFLNEHGFKLVKFTSYYKNHAADAVFINTAKTSALYNLKAYFLNKILQPLHHYGVLSAL